MFDNVTDDMTSNKKLNQILTGLFIRNTEIKNSTVFITESHFKVSRNVRITSTHF